MLMIEAKKREVVPGLVVAFRQELLIIGARFEARTTHLEVQLMFLVYFHASEV
jgi:hypothetical protein